MFEHLDSSSKRLLYNGLVALVRSNSGQGFHNNDQGHPAYVMGAQGKVDHEQWGDSPTHNHLFKIMRELSLDTHTEQGRDPLAWQDFCELATSAYETSKARN